VVSWPAASSRKTIELSSRRTARPRRRGAAISPDIRSSPGGALLLDQLTDIADHLGRRRDVHLGRVSRAVGDYCGQSANSSRRRIGTPSSSEITVMGQRIAVLVDQINGRAVLAAVSTSSSRALLISLIRGSSASTRRRGERGRDQLAQPGVVRRVGGQHVRVHGVPQGIRTWSECGPSPTDRTTVGSVSSWRASACPVTSQTGTPVKRVIRWTGPVAINSANAAVRALPVVSVKGEDCSPGQPTNVPAAAWTGTSRSVLDGSGSAGPFPILLASRPVKSVARPGSVSGGTGEAGHLKETSPCFFD